MFDCSKDVMCFHNDEVTLPQSDRSAMGKRRDNNRDRIKEGLDRDEDPKPFMFCKQGSYAMLTMVQHDDNHYDIDDGVYFEKADLDGKRGGEMSALDARKMVRDAVDDGSFKDAPEVRNNCVRILYAAGYHVDMPVYRRRIEKSLFGEDKEVYELASSDWKRSDARLVTGWFDKENTAKSPDEENGRQLRRVTRLIKKYAQSRESWRGQIASGFAITALVVECFKTSGDREDSALRDTIRAIRNRLEYNTVIDHPTTSGDTISSGNNDPKVRFLKEKLAKALEYLSVLDEADCSRADALSAWDKVYATDFFSLRNVEERSKSAVKESLLTTGMISSLAATEEAAPPRKRGGGNFA